MPSFVRLPARLRLWPVWVPAGLDWNVPPACTLTFEPTVSVRAVVCSYWRTPPEATVSEKAMAAVSIVTVFPVAIVTASPAPGTPAGDQVPGALQRPVPAEVLGVGAVVAWVPVIPAATAPSEKATTFQS